MEAVDLVCVPKLIAGEVWELCLERDGLALYDEEGELVTHVPMEEIALRVRFPSFWGGLRYLTIVDEAGLLLPFEPRPKAVAKVRDLVNECIYHDREAVVAATREKGKRDLLIGSCLLVPGILLSVASYSATAPGGTFYIMGGLLLLGACEVLRGVYWWGKAARLKHSAKPD
jgi:hypothetical protein